MPNLPTHISLALQAASRVGHPVIDRHLGCFLLGSTSPDIRIMTKWKRDQTHFAPLNFEDVGAGAQGLFLTHPNLVDSSRISDPTKVFLSGYFTHLLSDETWIVEVYRPYFDGCHLFQDPVEANIFDRALQLEMDRAAWDELGDREQVRASLDGSESGVDVGFIDAETLGKWREWVTEFTTRDFTWERLRFATRRMYQDAPEAQETVDEFLRSVPDSLERIYDKIPEEYIAAYREKVVESSARLIKEYLNASESD